MLPVGPVEKHIELALHVFPPADGGASLWGIYSPSGEETYPVGYLVISSRGPSDTTRGNWPYPSYVHSCGKAGVEDVVSGQVELTVTSPGRACGNVKCTVDHIISSFWPFNRRGNWFNPSYCRVSGRAGVKAVASGQRQQVEFTFTSSVPSGYWTDTGKMTVKCSCRSRACKEAR